MAESINGLYKAEVIHRKNEISLLLQASKYKYIHFEIIGKGDSCKNLIEFSYHDYNLKKQLIALTNAGFMSYVHRGNVTSLVHFDEIKNLWIPVKEKKFSINSDGIVYTLQRAACKINEKLLIVFSQMPIEPYSASLYRYFAKNFSTIDKYIGKNVSILRVADIGGITGSFYLNTNALPTNADKIKSLILEVIEQCQIKSDDVVLYGCSKGGTAAVYHGLTNNYKIVAVDPILNDEHYIPITLTCTSRKIPRSPAHWIAALYLTGRGNFAARSLLTSGAPAATRS